MLKIQKSHELIGKCLFLALFFLGANKASARPLTVKTQFLVSYEQDGEIFYHLDPNLKYAHSGALTHDWGKRDLSQDPCFLDFYTSFREAMIAPTLIELVQTIRTDQDEEVSIVGSFHKSASGEETLKIYFRGLQVTGEEKVFEFSQESCEVGSEKLREFISGIKESWSRI